jgi:PqqD family protein of HPr-rel-A system
MAADPPTYRQRAAFVTAPLDDELALLDVRSGTYLGFNATATAIWQRLERPASVDEICAGLMNDFEVDPTECRAGVERALQELLRRGLIERADA